jgi:hypothetical protein
VAADAEAKAKMKTDPRPADEEKDSKAEIDQALHDLLVGKVRIKVDPTTGQILEKSSLTDSPDSPTIL